MESSCIFGWFSVYLPQCNAKPDNLIIVNWHWQAFKKKYNLPYTLLSDEGNAVRKAFGVPADFFGALAGRQTYVVNRQGIVTLVYNNQFQPEKHVDETLKLLQAWFMIVYQIHNDAYCWRPCTVGQDLLYATTSLCFIGVQRFRNIVQLRNYCKASIWIYFCIFFSFIMWKMKINHIEKC